MASFGHAIDGLCYVFRTQPNARIQLSIGAVAFAVGLALGLDGAELAMIFLAIGLVLFAELVNTAVETVIDLVTAEYHPLAKIAKDVAAGAVLWTAVVAVIIGFLTLAPHLARAFGRYWQPG